MSTQQLGGTRQSSPLDNEMVYPLTSDEYLTIQENLLTDKLTNWESFLLTTGITSFISGIVILITGSFEKHMSVGGKDIIQINTLQVVLVLIYGALSVGTILGFLISKSTKKKSEKPMHRLDAKIMLHLNKINND